MAFTDNSGKALPAEPNHVAMYKQSNDAMVGQNWAWTPEGTWP